MATDAYIGDPFVFQVVYLDNLGAPIAVTSPTITIFYFEPVVGAKVTLVNGAAMVAATPSDPGRYVYRYVVPGALADGTVLGAEFWAVDPVTAFVMVTSETLNLHSHPTDLGLRVRFVR
jgi:hypothetical protein